MWHLGTRWTWQCWVNNWVHWMQSLSVSLCLWTLVRDARKALTCAERISVESQREEKQSLPLVRLLILTDSFKTWCCLNASAPLPILNWQFLTFFNPLGLTLFTVHLNLMASGNHGQSCLTLFRVFVMRKDSLSPTVTSLPIPKAPQKDHEFWLQSEPLIVATVWKNTK